MSTGKIRVGVAGLGRIGWRFHCGRLGNSRDFKLVAVADTDAAHRAEAEATYGCAAYEDYHEMIRHEGLEAVIIATPTHLHKEHSLAAFRKKLHVFLEKPMALNLAEARAIASAAKRAGCVLTVCQPRRTSALFQQVRKEIDSGRIGEIYHIRFGLFNCSRRNDWQSLTKFGGGMLNNYGAHAIDFTLALTGYDVKKSFCKLRRVASMGDAEDVVKILFETKSGKIGEIDINQASALRPYHLEVYGAHGALWQPDMETLKVRWYAPKSLKDKQLDAQLTSADRKYPSDDIRFREKTIAINPRHAVDQHSSFAKAIRKGERIVIHPDETLAVMKLIEQCRKQSGGITETLI